MRHARMQAAHRVAGRALAQAGHQRMDKCRTTRFKERQRKTQGKPHMAEIAFINRSRVGEEYFTQHDHLQ